MRGAFGLIGLVLALLIVALVAKKQMQAVTGQPVSGGAVSSSGASGLDATKPATMPAQVQQELDRAAQEAAKRLEQAEGANKP